MDIVVKECHLVALSSICQLFNAHEESGAADNANGAGYGDCGGIIRKAWEYRLWEGSYANGAGYGDCGGSIRKAWEYPSREGSSSGEDGI